MDMVADFFTKPLQGNLFRKFRALILNLPGEHLKLVGSDHRSVLKQVSRTKYRQDDPTPLASQLVSASLLD